MTLISHPCPDFSSDAARELLASLFGIDGALTPLPSERDQNFRVEAGDGRRFILKIVNAAEPVGTIAFQTAMIRHVEAVDPSLPVPRLVPPLTGEAVPHVHGPTGERHAVRLVSFVPGVPMATATQTRATLCDLGRTLGRLDRALASFGHPGAHHDLDWDIRKTPRSRARLGQIADPAKRAQVERILDAFDARVAPVLATARAGIIHNDANDWNVLVEGPDGGAVTGLIDFGDAVHAPIIAELAVACAYAMLDKPNPLQAAADVVAGYHAEWPLADSEFAVLLDLVAARLAISVTISASRAQQGADEPYYLISERPAWDLIARLDRIDRHIACAILRQACGLEAMPGATRVRAWLGAHRRGLAPLMDPPPARRATFPVGFDDAGSAVAKASAANDHPAAVAAYAELERLHPDALGLGGWGEIRSVYTAPFFQSKLIDGERRTMHIGLDIFAPAGTAMFTPLAATVVAATINPEPQDYGGLIMLEHEPEPGLRFRTLWGHLAHDSVRAHRVGDRLAAGALVARLGDFAENGGWLPHVHLQLVTAPYDEVGAIPGVGEASLASVWADLYPCPYDFAGLTPETFEKSGRDKTTLLAERRRRLGANVSISYKTPLKMMRGEDVWLIDDTGRAYLDCYNNVAHVGHCHPRVVGAIAAQAARLNTNTRYLHDRILDYTDRLAATLPDELDTFFLVCSGSEANELALRMARAATGRRDMLVIDWAYHGTTQGLIDISAYKYKRKGGQGRPPSTHELPVPETYRAPADWPAEAIGERYGRQAATIVANLVASGQAPAAFIAETIPSVAGQVFLPPGYLRAVYAAVRAAGGLCIADEVQVGFGRVGASMWAFEEHGVVPDIVTMGKPAGNGHPLAVVACKRWVADRFANGMEYFNTFGGNPVSAAAGLAVLEVLEDERLLANALDQGAHLMAGFRGLMDRYPAIGDVRGRGLFLGLEFVRDREGKAHDGAGAGAVVNRLRDLGVLAGTDGPFDNVIKLRPPMTFRREHGDLLLATLERALGEVFG